MSPITHPGERAPISDLQIVRLADEGVPIKALVRVFRRPFDDVERLLKAAVAKGEIVELPAADWPSDTRRDSRLPTIVAARGGAPMEFINSIRSAFGVSFCEATLLAELVWRGRASKAALHEVVSSEAEPKIIDVFVCKLRKKLEPHDIAIKTIWGWGYEISEFDRNAVLDHMRGTVISPAALSELISNADAAREAAA